MSQSKDPKPMNKRPGKLPASRVWRGVPEWLHLAYVFYAVVMLIAYGVKVIIPHVLALWERSPVFAASIPYRVLLTLSVGMVGWLLFQLRERLRFLYAALELGSGLGTGYFALSRLADTADRTAAAFGLLGSLYITVRAYDNYYKWRAERSTKATTAEP